MPVYHVTIGGRTYEVESPTELSDAEAHQHVLDSGAMGSGAGRFASGLWDSTVGGLKGLFSAAMSAPSPTPDSVAATLMKQFLGGQVDQGRKAVDSFSQGHYSEAAGHGAAAMLPVIGPAAAHAGERIAEGDVAGGLGEGTGLLLPGAASESGPLVSKAGRAVERVGNAGRGRTLTPASVTAAMGHPAMAAAEMVVPPVLRATGRGIQRVGDAISGGRDALTSGIQETAGNVNDAIHPPMSPVVEGSMNRAYGRQLVHDGMASPEDAAGIAGQDPFAYSKSTPISHNDIPTFNVNEGVRNVGDMVNSGFSPDAAVNVEAGGGKYGQSAADILRKMLKVRDDVQPAAQPAASAVAVEEHPFITRQRNISAGNLKYDPIADTYVPPEELSSMGREIDARARSIDLSTMKPDAAVPASMQSLQDMTDGMDYSQFADMVDGHANAAAAAETPLERQSQSYWSKKAYSQRGYRPIDETYDEQGHPR